MTSDSHESHDHRRRLREATLNIAAVAGLVCITAALASMLFGITPLIFRSGSMSPDIPTGSLALARSVPAEELKVGDVVSVVNDEDTRITHRIVGLEPSPGGQSVVATLQGDANNAPDRSPYVLGEADRVFFHLSGLGYPVAWLSSPVAIFLGGGLVGAVLVLAFTQPTSRRRSADLVNDDVDDVPHRGTLQEALHG